MNSLELKNQETFSLFCNSARFPDYDAQTDMHGSGFEGHSETFGIVRHREKKITSAVYGTY